MTGKVKDRKVTIEHQGKKVLVTDGDGSTLVLTLIYVPEDGLRLFDRSSQNGPVDIAVDQALWESLRPLKTPSPDGCVFALSL